MTGWAGYNAFLEFLRTPYYPELINWNEPVDLDFIWRPKISSEPADIITNFRFGKPLLVFFGGLGQDENGEAIYNWQNSTKHLQNDYSTIYLRDHYQAWFMNGVRGVTADFSETCALLEGVRRSLKSPYVVFVGQSGGGFAAIQHALHVEFVTHVVAVCPQTILAKHIECHAHGWLYRLQYIDDSIDPDTGELWDPLYDVNTGICSYSPYIHIWYGDDPVDVFHAERMVRCWHEDLFLHRLKGDHSGATTAFRDQEILGSFIKGLDVIHA